MTNKNINIKHIKINTEDEVGLEAKIEYKYLESMSLWFSYKEPSKCYMDEKEKFVFEINKKKIKLNYDEVLELTILMALANKVKLINKVTNIYETVEFEGKDLGKENE